MTPTAAERDARRPLLLVALATLVPFALLAIWARLVVPGALDVELLTRLQAPDEGPLALLVGALNTAGNLVPWALMVAVIAVAAALKGFVTGAVLVAVSALSDAAAFLVKLAVERERPEGAIVEHLLDLDSFAFPSGHVVRATALTAALLWLVAPARHRLIAALGGATIAATLMGYARVAAAAHWPSDALGGLLLGMGWFGLSAALIATRAAARRASG